MNDNTRLTRAPLTADTSSTSRFDTGTSSYRGPVNDRSAGLAGPTTGEDLIADARGNLTPAQMVERKLVQLLRGGPMPVSHMLNKAHR